MVNADLGQLLAWITGVGTLGITLWTALGKSKDTNWARVTGERDRLDKRVGELEQAREGDSERLDKVEAELAELKRHFDVLLDFLRDICGGSYDYEWVKRRAKDLLERMGR